MSKLPPLIVVLHETVVDLKTIVDLHSDPNFYGSYHTIIKYDGSLNQMVPADAKAFAAANSAFVNPYTGVTEEINGSVDDFAYHIAFLTPPDGRDPEQKEHTGYTFEQYDACAWLLRALGVDILRVTTHGQLKTPVTSEPRCLNTTFLFELYNTKAHVKPSIDVGIVPLVDKSAALDDLLTIAPRVFETDG